ncbi:MAG: ubiquinone-binding protein [Proteobacteria bacterium]|jgi:ribosome-associated toxin RatA of RatAB toxin-antitoxin module|nr:ubiquinone-binding protein [Pseudomonadota bacterium]
MPNVSRSALVEYSAEQMYILVKDIERYPAFLDWCGYAAIEEAIDSSGEGEGDSVLATVGVKYQGINKRFTTRNINTGNSNTGFAIDMELVEGPFSKLVGRWEFNKLSSSASKVSLNLEFEIKSILMRPLLTTVFAKIADRQVGAFCRRADIVYASG